MVNALVFALIGLFFVGISIPLIRSQVPPNRFYGFRTPKTLSNEKIWYEINRIMGEDLLIAGALITLSSLAVLVIGPKGDPRNLAFTLTMIMLFSLLGVLVHGFLALRRM